MNLPRTGAAVFVAACLVAAPARASDDHGHDHGEAAPATAGQALPRFAAVSDAFELVGVLSGERITLYLDRYADNSPVRGARIELEIGGARFVAASHGDDEYEVVLSEAPKPGLLPVTATVTVGQEADLLAGELHIHEPAHTHEAAPTSRWSAYAAWAAAGVAASALLAGVARRRARGRSARAGGAA